MKIKVYDPETKAMVEVEEPMENDSKPTRPVPNYSDRCEHGRIWKDLCNDCNDETVEPYPHPNGDDPSTKNDPATPEWGKKTCTHPDRKDYKNGECDSCYAARTELKSGYGNGNVYSSWMSSCNHSGAKPIFTLHGTEIRAVAGTKWFWETKGDLVLDCTNDVPKPMYVPKGYEALKRYLRPEDAPDTIYLPWMDQGAPPVAYVFWRELAKRLPKAPHKLIITCLAAHGRTGTALAALLLATYPKLSAQDAIKVVRTLHCNHAIESLKQEDYLTKMAACKWRKQIKGENAKVTIKDLITIIRVPPSAKDADKLTPSVTLDGSCDVCHWLPCRCHIFREAIDGDKRLESCPKCGMYICRCSLLKGAKTVFLAHDPIENHLKAPNEEAACKAISLEHGYGCSVIAGHRGEHWDSKNFVCWYDGEGV